ncbi:MAG TPA: hypothetical protein VJ183_20195 [Chloroflexia bacterium]|nr:hypothetical protein [Chloroflexia bacterium]
MEPQRPVAQVFCPNCRGGNPPGALRCMWCDALLAAYPPVAPVAPRRNMTWWIVGVAGVLVALSVVIFLIAFGGRRSSNQIGVYGMNETITLGIWKVVVEKTELVPEITGNSTSDKQVAAGHYLKVYMTVENIYDTTERLKPSDYNVRDSNDIRYPHCDLPACFTYPEREQRLNLNSEMPPHTPGKVLAIYDVLKGASGLKLEMEGPFERDRITIILDK